MSVFETSRLILRELTPADAAFVQELVNEPAWLQFIGDRGVRTLADAEGYIRKGPMASYAQHGFGLWCVARQADGVPLGMCGLLKRETLPDVDIGFAFLERFRGQGYAAESAGATLGHARHKLGLKRVLAITSPGNTASIRLLGKLGLRFEKMFELKPGDPVRLFAIEF
ncbi:MAG: GNAT family N-acetyltransferase [Opitutae bacterium]|nr:GNAT family N-acetyltransferase [Opitutae bacterium]